MTRTDVRLPRAAAITLLALCGCSVLEPREDPTRFYVLTASSSASATSLDPGVAVALTRIQLPEYLLRPEVVVRTGANEIAPSPVDRWAEALDVAVARVLREDLAALLPRSSFVPAPRGNPAVDADVEILRFEADRQGRASLEARWRLREIPSERRASGGCTLERRVDGDGTHARVAALSALLGDLAAALAADLGKGFGP